ncbi:hypothetical protein MPSEU_000260900 [Mayamaea pseudoterrestris]|nr:hypothetical protein MPSEU_000260900 [Mayamaea pseudoterrestris]
MSSVSSSSSSSSTSTSNACCHACGLEEDFCGGDGLAFKCLHCHDAKYCSPECLAWDWNRSGGHKSECCPVVMKKQQTQQQSSTVATTKNDVAAAAAVETDDQEQEEVIIDDEELYEVYDEECESSSSEDSTRRPGGIAAMLPAFLQLSPAAAAKPKLKLTVAHDGSSDHNVTDESEGDYSMNSMDMEAVFASDRHGASRSSNNSNKTKTELIKIAPPDPYAYKQHLVEQAKGTLSVKERQQAWQQTIASHQMQHSEGSLSPNASSNSSKGKLDLMEVFNAENAAKANKKSLGTFFENQQSNKTSLQSSAMEPPAEHSFHMTDDAGLLSLDSSNDDENDDDAALKSIQEDEEPSEGPDMEGSWRGREPFVLQVREQLILPETVTEMDNESFATVNSSSHASLHVAAQVSSGLMMKVDEGTLVRETITRPANAGYPAAANDDDSNTSVSENASSDDGSMEGNVQRLPSHLGTAAAPKGGEQESLDPSYVSYTVDGDEANDFGDSQTLNDESAGNFGNFFSDDDDKSGSNASNTNDVDSSDRRSLEGHMDDNDSNGTSRTDDTELLAAIPPSNHEKRPTLVALDERSVETSGGGSEDLSFFTRSVENESDQSKHAGAKNSSPGKNKSLLGSMLSKVAARQHPWSSPIAAFGRSNGEIARDDDGDGQGELHLEPSGTDAINCSAKTDVTLEAQTARNALPQSTDANDQNQFTAASISHSENAKSSSESPTRISLRSLKSFRKSYIQGNDGSSSKDLTAFRQIYQDDGSVSSAIAEVSTDAEQSTRTSSSGYSSHSSLTIPVRSDKLNAKFIGESLLDNSESDGDIGSSSLMDSSCLLRDVTGFSSSLPSNDTSKATRDDGNKSYAFFDHNKIEEEDEDETIAATAASSSSFGTVNGSGTTYSPVVVRVSEYPRDTSIWNAEAGFGVIPYLSDSNSSKADDESDDEDRVESAIKSVTTLLVGNMNNSLSDDANVQDMAAGPLLSTNEAGPGLLPDILQVGNLEERSISDDALTEQATFAKEDNPQQGDDIDESDSWRAQSKCMSTTRNLPRKTDVASFQVFAPPRTMQGNAETDDDDDGEMTAADMAATTATVSAAVMKLAGASQWSLDYTDDRHPMHSDANNKKLTSATSLSHAAHPEQALDALCSTGARRPPSANAPASASSRFQKYLADRNAQPESPDSKQHENIRSKSTIDKAAPNIYPIPILRKPRLAVPPDTMTSVRAEIAPGESFDDILSSAKSRKVQLKPVFAEDADTSGTDFIAASRLPAATDIETGKLSSRSGEDQNALDEKSRGIAVKDGPRIKAVWYCLLLLLLLLVILAIGLGAGLGTRNQSSEESGSATPRPTSSTSISPTPSKLVSRPTLSPTVATGLPTPFVSLPTVTSGFTQQERQLYALLAPLAADSGSSMASAGSPQNQALVWQAGALNFDSLSEAELTQRYALATLFYSTAGEQWTDSSQWLSDESECDWFSRSNAPCNGAGNLIDLSLGFNQVGGSLPPEIGLLTRLRALALSGGTAVALGGSLPSEIGSLTALTSLSLRANLMEGTLPTSLSALTALTFLDLSSNKFSGSLDDVLGDWNDLREMDLSANNFDGSIPDLTPFVNLQRLNLGANSFTGSLNDSVGQLDSLRELTISQNMITALSETLGLLPNLSILAAGENRLSGRLSPSLGASDSLRTIVLRSNLLSGNVPPELGRLSSLRYLDLSNNSFDGSIPTTLGNLGDLIDLQLQSNSLTGAIPTELSSLIRLGLIRIDGNDIVGTIPVEVCDVFSASLPVFYLDCGGSSPQISCPPGPCCTYCCSDDSGDSSTCSCVYEGTGFDFLC